MYNLSQPTVVPFRVISIKFKPVKYENLLIMDKLIGSTDIRFKQVLTRFLIIVLRRSDTLHANKKQTDRESLGQD